VEISLLGRIGKVLEMRSMAVLDKCSWGSGGSAAGLIDCKLLLLFVAEERIISHSTLTIPHSYSREFECEIEGGKPRS
jgi:hypothetical protein